MLYALYEAKLLDRSWLLSGMRPEKHFSPQQIPANILLAHFLV